MPTYTERAPGNYRARFTGVTDKDIVDKDSGEEKTLWLWTWQAIDDPTTAGQLDTITSPHFRARGTALKLFTGMLGRPPKEGDTTDALVGQDFDVQYGPNSGGRYTVTGALKVLGKSNPLPEPDTSHNIGDGDALPF